MAEIADIIKLLFNQALDLEEIYLKVGRATDIDLDDNTFTFVPNDETASVEKCLLKSITSAAGGSFVIVPSADSFVMVGFSSPTTAVLLFSESADKIIMNAETIDTDATNMSIDIVETLTINANQTIFNHGNNEGLIKIIELTAKLNELVGQVNGLRSAFNTHTHAGVSSGGSSSAGPSITRPNAVDVFEKTDYENTDITH